MGNLTCNEMVTELQRRITQLSFTSATAAVNWAIRWINRQGSYTFQSSGSVPNLSVANGTGLAVAPADMDMGKAHIITDVDTGLTIPKVALQDSTTDDISSIPINIPLFAYYTVRVNVFHFKPIFSVAKLVQLEYHVLSQDISGATQSQLPRDFDDLIVDLAEARERRIYDVGDQWVQLLAMVQDQIKVMLDGYRSTSMQVEPMAEAALAAQEKSVIGRA